MSAFAALMRRTRPSLVGLGFVMLALVTAVILLPQPSPVSATGVAAVSAGTGQLRCHHQRWRQVLGEQRRWTAGVDNH